MLLTNIQWTRRGQEADVDETHGDFAEADYPGGRLRVDDCTRHPTPEFFS